MLTIMQTSYTKNQMSQTPYEPFPLLAGLRPYNITK